VFSGKPMKLPVGRQKIDLMLTHRAFKGWFRIYRKYWISIWV